MRYFVKILLIFLFSIVYLNGFSQQNISSSTVNFTGISYKVKSIIGDSFLGNSYLSNYSLEHSILSASKETILGLKKENLIELKVYPNPFTSTLQFHFQSESKYEIIIISTIGSEIIRVKTYANISLEMDDIPKGLYIVKVLDLTKNKISVFEVIKL